MRHLQSFRSSLIKENDESQASLEFSFDLPRIEIDENYPSAYSVIYDRIFFDLESDSGFLGIIKEILREDPIETDKDLEGETIKLDLAQIMRGAIKSHFGMSNLNDIEKTISKKSKIDFSPAGEYWKEALDVFKQMLTIEVDLIHRNFQNEIKDIFLNKDSSVDFTYN